MEEEIKKLIKTFDLSEDLKMLQDFYTFLNFNFTIIYIIHTILVFLQFT